MELKADFFVHTDMMPVTSGSNEVFIKIMFIFIFYKQCIFTFIFVSIIFLIHYDILGKKHDIKWL